MIADLNACGKRLKEDGIELLYHNHNCEFRKIDGQTAYDRIIENTDPKYVNFEFDSYWPTEAGVNTVELMRRPGKPYQVVSHQRQRQPCRGKDFIYSDLRQHGTGLRQYGFKDHGRYCEGKWCGCCCSGKS